MEIVQAEGGVIPAPTEFVRGVRRVTSELDIPLIVDEIQTGCGRTGTWYAFEQHGIVPDVILASKALGGIGMPIAVVFYNKRLDVWAPGAHTATFRGNQLAFAAGIAAVKIIQRDGCSTTYASRAPTRSSASTSSTPSTTSSARCAASASCSGWRSSIRRPAPPDSALALRIQRGALERGLIVELGGRDDCVVRLLPPLNVTRETLDQALDVMESTFAAVRAPMTARVA